MLMYEYLTEDNLRLTQVDLQTNQVMYEITRQDGTTGQITLNHNEVPLVLRGTQILLGQTYPLMESSTEYQRIQGRLSEELETPDEVANLQVRVSYHVHNYMVYKRYTSYIGREGALQRFDAYKYIQNLDKYRNGDLSFTDYMLHDYSKIQHAIDVTSIEEEQQTVDLTHIHDRLEDAQLSLEDGYPSRYRLNPFEVKDNQVLYKETTDEFIVKTLVIPKSTRTSKRYPISKESKEHLPWLKNHPTSDTLEVYVADNGLGIRVRDAKGGILEEALGVYNSLAYKYMLYGNNLPKQ